RSLHLPRRSGSTRSRAAASISFTPRHSASPRAHDRSVRSARGPTGAASSLSIHEEHVMRSRTPLITVALSVALVLALAFQVFAGPKPDKSKPDDKSTDAAASAAGADKDKPYGDWKKLVKDADVMKGYFTVYRKRETLYLE